MTDTTLDLSTVLKFGTHEAMLQDISPKGLLYLVQYGFKQSMQDSIAGYEKKLADEKNEDGTAKYTKDEITQAVIDRQSARFDDILAGEVGTRTGAPRLSGIEKIMRDVARETIKAAAVAKGMKVPTGETMTKFAEQYVAKHEAKVRAEAQRRLDSQSAVKADDDEFSFLEEAAEPKAE